MTFPTIELLVCFAALSAMVFKLFENLYQWTSPGYINKKKLLRKIETMIDQETERLHDPNTYPSVKQQATSRINVLIYINEIIKTL